MSEPEGRANHERGFCLATKWRAVIGVDSFGPSMTLSLTWMVHQ
jgi:hypothetical protein